MQAADFKTIFASVRPARVAVLLDRSDPDWQDSCLRIIEFFSSVWGGKYNIIVPTDGQTISRTFWDVLESFDADYLYRYQKTMMDLKMARPEKYNEILERETDKFIGADTERDRQAIREQIDGQLRMAPDSRFGVSQELQKEIKQRLAPFYLNNHIVQAGGITAGSVPHFQLTAVAKILPNCEHPDEIVSPEVTCENIPRLWYASITGQMAGSYKEALEAIGIRNVSITLGEEKLGEIFDLVTKGETPYQTRLPFEVSSIHVTSYRSLKCRWWEEPAVVVCGETMEDFCLYYCLARLRGSVMWLLPSWLTNFSEAQARARSGGAQIASNQMYAFHLAHELLQITRQIQAPKRVVLLSNSLDRAQLENCRDILDEASVMGPGSLKDLVEVRESLDGLLRFPLVLYERDNIYRDVTKQFLENELPGVFETPKPKNFRTIDPHEHRWITELVIKGQQFPRHPALGEWMIRHNQLGTHGARSSLNGLAYFCPNIAFFGGDIDSALVKPKLFIPTALEVFRRVAESAGLACEVSDKGRFAQETTSKFGGLDKVGHFLRDKQKRALLDKFLDATKPGKGIHDEGVFLKSDNRRYLNLGAIAKIIGDGRAASQLINDLVIAGVFYRGFIFKCAHCRNADWFAVGEITQQFTCKRCGRQQVYTEKHWREPLEPAWFYKLDEIVYQGHRQNMIVPLLALDYLRRQAKDSFLYCPELEVFETGAEKPFCEIDLCCVPDGVLSIGEAKKEDRLGESAAEEQRAISKYREVAGKIGARKVVFATLAPEWAETVRKNIEITFRGQPIKVELLTQTELLSE